MSHGTGNMELARIHSQLQGSSAKASHFLDVETCEFPSLSMLPVLISLLSTNILGQGSLFDR